MLMKLAFKNIGKSLRDYAIYFLTLTLGVSIFYTFNSIYTQRELMTVTESTAAAIQTMTQTLSYVSVFIAVIFGFLIVYANNFFIKRRKKELGVYMTLGMSKKYISVIFILETSFMALLALTAGLLLGVFSSQFMSIFTANLFEADLTKYKFIFSFDAALKSVMYFAVIFFVIILFNVTVINKLKLIDLLYGGRKNEIPQIKSTELSLSLFILSVLLLAAAYCSVLKYDGTNLNDSSVRNSVILGAAGTFLFFFSLSGFLVKLLQSRKKLYYNNLNMFVIRQFNSKINTNFISVSIVSLTLFLVIVIFSTGYSAQNIMSSKLKEQVQYDFTLESAYNNEETDVPEIFKNLPSDIQSSNEIKNYTEYTLLKTQADGGRYGDYDLDFSVISSDISRSPLYFMKLSEFNRLRQINGLPAYTLPEKRCLITYEDETLSAIADQFINKKTTITIGTNNVTPMESSENLIFGNRYFGGIVFVIEDSSASHLNVQRRILNINCTDEKAASSLQKKLQSYWEAPNENPAFVRYDCKQDIYANDVTDKALISFLAIYLGFVLMITCAAVLAVQQLSEAADNKARYNLLKKLGTEKKMLNKALFIQILSYFLLPLLLAAVHSAVGLKAVYNLLNQFGHVNIISGIVTTAAFVIVIYGAYFALTYIGSKNIINKN